MESATTELVRLPGLDVAVNTERPEAKPGHWIERGPLKRLMVFSGRSHPELAQRIAEQLGVELGEVELKTFSNGETYCRYHESIRGADVFIVQTGCAPVDRNLMELLFMIQAAKLASAKRITAVVPWFPYSRQDRKALPREPISGRLVADMIQLAGADRVLTMDLHAGQIQGFFTIPVDHMTSLPLFARHFRDLGLSGDAVVSVAPDAGRAKHAIRFAEMIEGDFAVMHKTRPEHDKASVTEITGPREGQGGDRRRRRDHDRRHVARRRRGPARARRDRGLGLHDARPLLRRRPRAVRRGRSRGDRRHGHGAHRPGEPTFEHDGATDLRPAGRDDHERLRRRVRLRDLRRRVPALLRLQKRRRTRLMLAALGLLVLIPGVGGASCKLLLDCGTGGSDPKVLQPGLVLETVASGFRGPSAFAFLPDGRILVAQVNGLVRVVRSGKVLGRPFLDLRGQINTENTRGLVGLEPDPEFARNGQIYVMYAYEDGSEPARGEKPVRVARVTARGNRASLASEVVILGRAGRGSCQSVPVEADCIPANGTHMGGALDFAPDGTLFVGTGDGELGKQEKYEPGAHQAQNLDALTGKILRVTRSGKGLPTNPFWTGDADDNRSKVWAYGLRNPFRVSVRPGSLLPYVGDVGWNEREEIDVANRGVNLGWPCYEGSDRPLHYRDTPACLERVRGRIRSAGAGSAPGGRP